MAWPGWRSTNPATCSWPTAAATTCWSSPQAARCPLGSVPFTGLNDPTGLAVDQPGDVFVANSGVNQVLELSAGGTQTTLGFTGLSDPTGVAVDSAGDVFVANKGANQILELTAGGTQTTLGFTGLSDPTGVAVDSAGDVFVANKGANQILELTAGGTQTTLGFTGLSDPTGVAVDSAGDVFVANKGANSVVELPAGNAQETLPFDQLDAPYGVAVDTQNDVYVSNFAGNDVVSLTTLAKHLYAAPNPRGRGNCLDPNDACVLATALAEAAPDGPGYTIYLTQAGTPGDASSYYIGNWTLNVGFTTSNMPLTIAPEPGLAGPPILDGDGTGAGACETASCDGPVLSVVGGTTATVEGLTIQNGPSTGPRALRRRGWRHRQ